MHVPILHCAHYNTEFSRVWVCVWGGGGVGEAVKPNIFVEKYVRFSYCYARVKE